jgi:hypothetical protein
MKLIYTVAAMAVSVTANNDLPDPPVCVNDCPLFDMVATGTVDDCAVLSQWSASGCLSDCGLSDHAVLAHISNQFCRRLESTDGFGSYGGSYDGSYEDDTTDPTAEPSAAPTTAPTPAATTAEPSMAATPEPYACQDSLYDATFICATIAPAAAEAGGCANLLGVQFPSGPVTEDDLDLFAVMCPGTCSDLYTSPETGLPACECMPEYYTCLDSETPPCQNNPGFVDETGQDMCAQYEGLMAENGIVADKCDSFANLAVASEGGNYEDYVLTLSALGTYCPILCDSCDGFAPTAEENWTPESPCARVCAPAEACFLNGVFQDFCPPEAAGCAPCFPAAPTLEPTPSPTEATTEATTEEGDLVVKLEMQMTFTEELDTDEVAAASGAIEVTVADESGIDADYVTATMTLADDGGRRHLLSISYDVLIVITIPAADLEGADDTLLAALVTLDEIVASDAGLEELTAAITSNEELVEINGGDAIVATTPTLETVGDFPIQVTVEPQPASASMVSPALGLLVSAVCVAASL